MSLPPGSYGKLQKEVPSRPVEAAPEQRTPRKDHRCKDGSCEAPPHLPRDTLAMLAGAVKCCKSFEKMEKHILPRQTPLILRQRPESSRESKVDVRALAACRLKGEVKHGQTTTAADADGNLMRSLLTKPKMYLNE